jgi:hypothetical protein
LEVSLIEFHMVNYLGGCDWESTRPRQGDEWSPTKFIGVFSRV